MSTNSMTATTARREFAAVLETIKEGSRVVVTRHGRPVGVIVGLGEFGALGIEATQTFEAAPDYTLSAEVAADTEVLPGE